MKRVLTAIVLVGLSQGVMADDATGNFQWAGSVPQANTGNNTTIVNLGPIDHSSGMLVFEEDIANPGQFLIKDSSSLIFGVEESGALIDSASGGSFDYEIQSLRFSSGGSLMESVNPTTPEFAVVADGTTLDSGVPITGASGPIALQIETPQATPLGELEGGDDVVVQATILVTSATI